ncbi:hypothetical protein M404DRAFT_27642 [Pisolithus tinctorius Marx 270]|uniref:Uncharacterized protein n=1 Tax=Pisolithus tinctorius Marx 270 TaxID=870435 RepID=A0A0C3NPC4_PISTI|nr:hypothetical protein M404DRAFT_27642 [Pisolithus tinctorius Marx 270]
MSANCAPCLLQLVCVATPDLIKVEKTALKVKFIVASMALVAEARCLPDDKEELWEEKGEEYPIIEHGQELGIDTKIDAMDGPAIAEADKAYERWVAEEIAHRKADEDVQMEEEVTQAIGGQGASVVVLAATEKMSHVEVVAWLVRKTIIKSEDEDEPKIVIPPSLTLHKQRCEKLTKAMGKRVQAGASVAQASKTTKASPSKRAVDDDDNDDDEVEVVESHMHAKGKAPVHSWLDAKVMANLLQSLRLLHAEAAELQAAYLHLQVCQVRAYSDQL